MRVDPKHIIKTLKANDGRIRQTARILGVSPGTVINWRQKARSIYSRFALSTRRLARQSTRPQTVRATTMSASDQDRLAALRKKSGLGAVKLRFILQIPKHPTTVHRFLKHKGLVESPIAYRRPRLQPTIHMHAKNATAPGKLQMDVKYITPELSGLPHTLYLYAVMDIWTRYKAGILLPLLDQSSAIEAVQFLRARLPLQPDFIQTDNGLEFQARFHAFVTKDLAWHHHYIHKSQPNENAVIERSFRTDEEEFFFWRYEGSRNLEELETQYQVYLHEYNNIRPHLSLNLMTPVQKLQTYKGVQ